MAKSATHYIAAGMILESEIELPPLDQTASHIPDVTIKLGAVPAGLADVQAIGPNWQKSADQFLLDIPAIARFLVTSGREIVVSPAASSSVRDAAPFLTGTVLGILLHQRGMVMLHASAVKAGGKAILFCGPSGAGKSTLAAALVQRGYPLISDDICIISRIGGVPHVVSDGRCSKLWDEAVGRLGLEKQRGEAVRAPIRKYFVTAEKAETVPIPAGAIYGLQESRLPDDEGIRRLELADGASLLRQNAFRPQLIQRFGHEAEYFAAYATIAATAGIFRLIRPLDFSKLDKVTGWLKTHWAEQGLGAVYA